MRHYATPLLSCTTLLLILCNSLSWPELALASPSSESRSSRPSVLNSPHWATIAKNTFVARNDDASNGTPTTTGSLGKTAAVSITTVTMVPSHGPNKLIHDGNYGRQLEKSEHTTVTDPNKDDDSDSNEDIADQFREDQAALRRIVTILSVVGGVGAVVVVAVIVIFARLRVRKRKQRELENEENRLEFDNDALNDSDSSHGSVLMAMEQIGTSRRLRTEGHSHRTAVEAEPTDGSINAPSPTAPPVPLLASLDAVYDPLSRQRHVISMVSQTTPAPSAPTAKELDAMVDEGGEPSTAVYPPASTSAHCSTQSSCPHCGPSPMVPQEIPPPAYTPSAPPMYDLPTEPIVLNSSLSAQSSTSLQDVVPRGRRHSQA